MTTKQRNISNRGSRKILVSLVVWASIACVFFLGPCSAYSPDVNHRAIAGLWKLKQTPTSSSPRYPLKEFTVYPKVSKKHTDDSKKSKEVLLMLKEDGSFQQYSDQEQKAPDKLRFIDSQKINEKANDGAILDRYCEFGKLQGKWELVGGKLILAADRPMGDDGKTASMAKTSEDNPDTILEGEVVATMEEGLSENPVLGDDFRAENSGDIAAGSSGNEDAKAGSDKRNEAKTARGGKPSRNSVVDTHLSVPNGQVNIGRFTYPQHHPSFFEAPMFNPRAGGRFELKQVLGTLNTQQQQDEEVFEEKFSVADFYNKTFLLTSHPIPEYQPKGNIRWSIKYNKFVEDPPPKSKKQKNEEENMDQPMHNIRVLEVKFFANNTFATIGGMGGSAILRGRFSVIGQEKDHIWMQVIRFGFGRSVSGSVFSEGKSLTKDDEKAYWGKIEYVDEDVDKDSNDVEAMGTEPIMDGTEVEEKSGRLLKVKGSVLFGYGLEPLPIGQFVLSETDRSELENDDDDDDDEDIEDFGGFLFDSDPDDFFDSDDAFQ